MWNDINDGKDLFNINNTFDVDEDEESFEDDGMDVGAPDYDEALDAEVDDDELFESKKKK